MADKVSRKWRHFIRRKTRKGKFWNKSERCTTLRSYFCSVPGRSWDKRSICSPSCKGSPSSRLPLTRSLLPSDSDLAAVESELRTAIRGFIARQRSRVSAASERAKIKLLLFLCFF
jgi:hypothetical protein